MMRIPALIGVLAGLTLTGCGDDGASQTETGGQPVQITAASKEDQSIADELWEDDVKQECRDVEPPPASRLRSAFEREPAIERYFIRRYGSVENYFESLQRACESYQRISVEDRVITVSTDLPSGEQGELDADHICNTIQGSDVADFETHTILDRDGDVLFTCRRSGP